MVESIYSPNFSLPNFPAIQYQEPIESFGLDGLLTVYYNIIMSPDLVYHISSHMNTWPCISYTLRIWYDYSATVAISENYAQNHATATQL